MFAKYPRTASDSLPNTPGGPRRRIRCKMCRYVKLWIFLVSLGCLSVIRQELATREHMLDHGQLGPATPVDSPVASRRSSNSSQVGSIPRRPSHESAPRRPSRLSFSSKFSESLSMSSIEPKTTNGFTVQIAHSLHTLRNSHTPMDPTLSTSALETEDESETELNAFLAKEDASIDAAQISGLQLSDAIVSTKAQLESQSQTGDTPAGASPSIESPTTHFISPTELASQLLANPNLAALRSPDIPVSQTLVNSPPILLNAKCSGYFVEPVSP